MEFDIEADDDSERAVQHDIHDQNVAHDLVEYSRSKQVLNEEQTLTTTMIYAGGWLPDWHDYNAGVITGGSAGGKSHMKQEVIDDFFAYLDDALYNPTGVSPKAIIDDDRWDDAKVGALNELQKIPPEMLEFLKSAHGDDGGFDYRRNVSDGDAESGYSAMQIERDPKPVVFMLADENDFTVGQELRTRMIEIKVDENEEKNRGVHRMKWGHERIELPSYPNEYVWSADELWHAVRTHIRDMADFAETIDDVLIPTGEGRFEGDDWDAGDVTEPMFNFARSDSARASDMMASLVRASALLNYHARETVEQGDDTCLVVEPHDVANMIACRRVLLATTHGLTEKKFAVLNAIRERGGKASATGTAVQATKQDIIEEIQENNDIATLSKSEITDILNELDEHLIINKKDNPEDRRQKLYVYDGGAVFDAPNIFDYYDKFKDIEDPIRNQPVEQTIEEQLEELNAKMDTSTLSSAGSESGSEGLQSFDSASPSDLDEIDSAVAQRLSEVMDGSTVPEDVMDENSLKISHMVGATPVDESDGLLRPEREPRGDDRAKTIMDPNHELWPDDYGFNDVEGRLEEAVETLTTEGVLSFDETDGGTEVSVAFTG